MAGGHTREVDTELDLNAASRADNCRPGQSLPICKDGVLDPSQPGEISRFPAGKRAQGFARQRMTPTRRVEHEGGKSLSYRSPVEVTEHALVARICPVPAAPAAQRGPAGGSGPAAPESGVEVAPSVQVAPSIGPPWSSQADDSSKVPWCRRRNGSPGREQRLCLDLQQLRVGVGIRGWWMRCWIPPSAECWSVISTPPIPTTRA